MSKKHSEENLALTLWDCNVNVEAGEKNKTFFLVYIYLVAEEQDGLGKSGTINFAFDQKANMPEAVSALDCHILNSGFPGEERGWKSPKIFYYK